MVTPKSHFILYQNCVGTRRPQNIHQAKISPLPSNKLTKNTTDIIQQNFWPRSESPLLLFILFYFFHFSSAYQVVVLKVADCNKNLPPDFDSKLKNSEGDSQYNIDFYVSAEISNDPVHEKTWTFIAGDEKNYGAYKNAALQQGEDYIVFQRALPKGRTEKVNLV